MEKSRCRSVIGCKEPNKKQTAGLTETRAQKRAEEGAKEMRITGGGGPPGGLIFAEKQLKQRV